MWKHLLWKDARQVLPGVAIYVGLTVLGQLLSIWTWGKLDSGESVLVGFTFVCPFVIVLLCLGTLFGNESQTRTMHWQSTLPILWYRSLASKWVMTMIATSSAFLVTFGIMYWANEESVHFHTAGIHYDAMSFGLYILYGIVPLALFSSIFVLLVDEPLYGLGLAGFAFATCLTSTMIWMDANTPGRYGGMLTKSLLPIIVFLGQVTLSTVMILVYRWRWYRGHQASMYQVVSFAVPWIANVTNSKLPASLASMLMHKKTRSLSFANRPFLSLLAQSVRQAWLFRLMIVFAPWLWFASMNVSVNSRAMGGLVVGVTFTVFLLGLSCFTHDHSKQRIRFLSDRGISAWQFYLARTIPTLLASACSIAAVAIALLCYEGLDSSLISMRVLFVVGFLCIYFVGQLVGLCLRNVILSIAVAILILYGNFIIGSLITFGSQEVNRSSFQSSYEDFITNWVVQALCFWMLIVILVSIFWTVPQWLRWEKTRFGLGTGLVLAGFVSPALLIGIFTTAAYLSLPSPKWIVDTQPLKTSLSVDETLIEYRQRLVERSAIYQKGLTESNPTPELERTFAMYGIENTLPFEKPTNSFLFISNALINRFILSNMSREFAAEIEAVDELIVRSNQASQNKASDEEALQVYLKARARHGLPDLEQSPLSSHRLYSRIRYIR